jgi:hypothetical protein
MTSMFRRGQRLYMHRAHNRRSSPSHGQKRLLLSFNYPLICRPPGKALFCDRSLEGCSPSLTKVSAFHKTSIIAPLMPPKRGVPALPWKTWCGAACAQAGGLHRPRLINNMHANCHRLAAIGPMHCTNAEHDDVRAGVQEAHGV